MRQGSNGVEGLYRSIFWTIFLYSAFHVIPFTVKPLYDEVLGVTNDFLQPGLLKCMEKNLSIRNQFL